MRFFWLNVFWNSALQFMRKFAVITYYAILFEICFYRKVSRNKNHYPSNLKATQPNFLNPFCNSNDILKVKDKASPKKCPRHKAQDIIVIEHQQRLCRVCGLACNSLEHLEHSENALWKLWILWSRNGRNLLSLLSMLLFIRKATIKYEIKE